MADSIARKVFLIALAIAAPPVLAIQFLVASATMRLVALAWGILLTLVAWLLGRSLARRINRLTDFADRLLSPDAPRPLLPSGEDETGVLARSLARVAPQIEELVNRLGMELARREAILASMTDAVLAVDSGLNLTFCNHAFVQAIGNHEAPQGVPLVRVFRNPALLEVLTRVLDSGKASGSGCNFPAPKPVLSMSRPCRWPARPTGAPSPSCATSRPMSGWNGSSGTS